MVIREWLKKYNADEILFFLAVIFKPLYLLPSGSFQIGDFLFFAAVLVHFLKGSDKELFFPIHREEHSLLIFVAGVLVINFTYFVLIGTKDFLINSAYYVFNFLVVMFAADILQTNRKNEFLKGLCVACKIVLLIQLLIYIAGNGESQPDGRYMGTFNDPNQFAVYIMLCLFIMLDVYHAINIKTLFWLVMSIVLIIPSGSTGTIMAVGMFIALFIILSIATINKRKFMIGAAGIILLVTVFIFAPQVTGSGAESSVVEMMRSRLEDKLSGLSGTGDMLNFLINDRIWNRVFEQPKYLLYGAGEGAHSRFDPGNISHEVHSSILGPMYYYGIGVVFFLFRWVFIKLKHIDGFQLCIYLALIAESVILVNYRQPLFWFLFVLAGREKHDTLAISSINETKHVDPAVVKELC